MEVVFMKINNKLIDFLNDAGKLSHCNILLTNEEKFVFSHMYYEEDVFTNKHISNDLKKILKFCINDKSFTYTTISPSNPCIKLIESDNINYTAEMILPIFTDKLDGLLIFFSTDRKYLESNLRFAKTTKYFTEKLSI